MNEEQTKNLQDYLAAFRRRRAQIAAIFVVILVVKHPLLLITGVVAMLFFL